MYRVQLQNFEGPLDLLLFFIRRDELDIYDIPIAYITQQYLEYIHYMGELDLSVASEFIYMASTLMSIKAKMMLPREVSAEDALDEQDPRYELVQSLLEFKRYKEMGEEMASLETRSREQFRRRFFETDVVEAATDEEPLRDVSLFDLIAAYKLILNRAARVEVVHRVELAKTNIEQQSRIIVDRLRTTGRMNFWELCAEAPSRMVVIVIFLAILEMVREGQLVLYVEENSIEFAVDLPSAASVLASS
jgi:segregation and condensation protein A